LGEGVGPSWLFLGRRYAFEALQRKPLLPCVRLYELQAVLDHAEPSLQKGLALVVFQSFGIPADHVLLLVLDQPLCHFPHDQVGPLVLDLLLVEPLSRQPGEILGVGVASIGRCFGYEVDVEVEEHI
jgi:hypothetical protein